MFTLNKVHVAINSKLNISNEDCPICKNNLLDRCLECTNSNNTNCNSVIGKCGHGYHNHCISMWCKTRNVCPLDNQLWKSKTK